jgi:small-conductance mechanosensitive channel
LFLDFGDSTLNFELRVWVIDADNRMATKSDLHQDIDRRFRKANIEIAFPQRDLHLRSIDPSIQLKPKDPGK